MVEIEKLFINNKKSQCASISLFGKLETVVGNYFLSEVTNGIFCGLWNSVYFDSTVNPETESVECVSENLIGYVDKEIRWAFILDRYMEKFKRDTAEYELDYISVPSLQQKILRCNNTDNLPCEFSSVLWIDDDFMYDENIPFNFNVFSIIDEGKNYLNPKHFSVDELIKSTQIEVMEAIL